MPSPILERLPPGPPPSGFAVSVHYLNVDPLTFEAMRGGLISTFAMWDRRKIERGDWLRICTRRKGINVQMTAYITEVEPPHELGRVWSGEFSFEPLDGD